MMSNQLPSLADSSGAFASRFILLRLTKSFLGQEDHDLDERINAELPGILNWALDGLERLKERGHFIQPASALPLVEQLESLSSPIKEFLNDDCEIVPGARVEVQVLFKHWVRRCEEQNRKAESVQQFGTLIAAAAPSVYVYQGRIPGDRRRYYVGIRLKQEY
jgi:putative DNA primase/helicase